MVIEINSWTELRDIINDYAGEYILKKNLSSTDNDYEGIGDSWIPIGNETEGSQFTGVFDGNSKTISDLIVNTSTNYAGLFGYSAGTIKNINLLDVDIISTAQAVGGITGNNTGIISNCNVTGSISGSLWVGGISGRYAGLTGSYINDCSFDGDIVATGATSIVGGLVGNFYFGNMYNCYSKGTVSGLAAVGGAVAYIYNDATISECYSLSVVTGTAYVGGFAGRVNRGTISNCYALGAVTGTGGVSSFVGAGLLALSNMVFNNCYSTGLVTGGTSGFIGSTKGRMTFNNCYWDMDTTGQTTTISTAVGKTTAEMKLQETYTNWDFITIWGISASLNSGYPYLIWQYAKKPKKLKIKQSNRKLKIKKRNKKIKIK